LFRLLHRGKSDLNILRLSPAGETGFQCGHVVTTFQYGAHPARVYAFCPFCKMYARLDWKDTSARVTNRVWGTLPLVIQGSLIMITLGFIVWAVITLSRFP
jgi:hypothetical protein